MLARKTVSIVVIKNYRLWDHDGDWVLCSWPPYSHKAKFMQEVPIWVSVHEHSVLSREETRESEKIWMTLTHNTERASNAEIV